MQRHLGLWVVFSGGSQLPRGAYTCSPVGRPRGEKCTCQHQHRCVTSPRRTLSSSLSRVPLPWPRQHGGYRGHAHDPLYDLLVHRSHEIRGEHRFSSLRLGGVLFCSEGSLIQWLKQAAALWTDLLTPGKAYRVGSPRPGRYASSHPVASSPLGRPLLPLPGVGGQDPFRDSPGKESPMGPVPPTPAVSLTEPPHLGNPGGGQPSDPQRPCGPVNSVSPLLGAVEVSRVAGPVLPLLPAPRQGRVSPVLAGVPVPLNVSSSTLFALNCGSGLSIAGKQEKAPSASGSKALRTHHQPAFVHEFPLGSCFLPSNSVLQEHQLVSNFWNEL